MDFISELKWRGMIQDHTPGVEEYLDGGTRRGYIGFDPTAPSLTIGNLVQLMILTFFQRAGHQPVVLMGGATGRIGDPSGKDEERTLKSVEEIESNLLAQQRQIEKLLKFDSGDNAALLVDNYEFYRDMNVLDYLRNVGKTLTVNYMMAKESVQNRLEKGISYTEFSYQLLQAYDYQCLFEKYHCALQMGGSDQWGNITAGTEFIRRNLEEKAYAVTTPLLTRSDGSKFGKSESGNIWLDPDMTTPYEFYQFWINADDRDLPKYFRYFSLKSRVQIEAMEKELREDPRQLKRILADELTSRIHSQKALESVQKVSELLFNKKAGPDHLRSMDEQDLKMVAREIPSATLSQDLIKNRVNLIDLLTDHTDIQPSKGEARRSIKGNAVAVNKEKVTDFEAQVGTENLLHGKYIMIEIGKKNKHLIVFQ